MRRRALQAHSREKNTNRHETHTKLINATVHFGPRAHEIVVQD